MKEVTDATFAEILRSKFIKLTDFLDDPWMLQVGAADGKIAETLHDQFMSADWNAVLLEPLPDMFQRLQKTYSNKPKYKLVNAALAQFDGYVNIRRIPPEAVKDDELWALGISSIDGVRSSFTVGGQVPDATAIDLAAKSRLDKVRTISFQTLVASADLRKIDYLQIDTEGYDLVVLQEIDLQRFRPLLINCEIYNLSHFDRAKVFARLQAHGYDLTVSEWDVMGAIF